MATLTLVTVVYHICSFGGFFYRRRSSSTCNCSACSTMSGRLTRWQRNWPRRTQWWRRRVGSGIALRRTSKRRRRSRAGSHENSLELSSRSRSLWVYFISFSMYLPFLPLSLPLLPIPVLCRPPPPLLVSSSQSVSSLPISTTQPTFFSCLYPPLSHDWSGTTEQCLSCVHKKILDCCELDGFLFPTFERSLETLPWWLEWPGWNCWLLCPLLVSVGWWCRWSLLCCQEVELNKKRPVYIKAKEKTTHMQRKVENSRWVNWRDKMDRRDKMVWYQTDLSMEQC